MLNRKASRTREHSDEAAVLDMEGLVQEQLHPGNKELGLWEADSELTWCAEQWCVLGCGVIVPGCSFWLLDSSVWLKGWCESCSPVLIISNPRCVVTLQMRWTLPWADSMEIFGLIKCSLQPVLFPPVLLHLKAPTRTSWSGHKQRITFSGKNQPSSSTLLPFMLHLQMLTALGRVSVTPAQAIYPSFHPALGGLVQLGSPCSALREGEFPEVKPGRGSRHKEEDTGEKQLCFARRPGLCSALGSLKSPPPVTPGISKDACWHTLMYELEMRLCLLENAGGSWHGLRVVPGNVIINALCFQGDFAAKWWEGTEITSVRRTKRTEEIGRGVEDPRGCDWEERGRKWGCGGTRVCKMKVKSRSQIWYILFADT